MAVVELDRASAQQGFQLPLLEGKPVQMAEFENQLCVSEEEIFEVFSSKTEVMSGQIEMGAIQDGFDLNGVTH